jgi:hypothetical protein
MTPERREVGKGRQGEVSQEEQIRLVSEYVEGGDDLIQIYLSSESTRDQKMEALREIRIGLSLVRDRDMSKMISEGKADDYNLIVAIVRHINEMQLFNIFY